jgi:hypothetical protein
MAGLCTPLPTLRHSRRTARGRCGSLHLHREGLSPSTPCRFNRRTLFLLRERTLLTRCTGAVLRAGAGPQTRAPYAAYASRRNSLATFAVALAPDGALHSGPPCFRCQCSSASCRRLWRDPQSLHVQLFSCSLFALGVDSIRRPADTSGSSRSSATVVAPILRSYVAKRRFCIVALHVADVGQRV